MRKREKIKFNVFIISFLVSTIFLTLYAENSNNNRINSIKLSGYANGFGNLIIEGSCSVNEINIIGRSETKNYELIQLQVDNCINSGVG